MLLAKRASKIQPSPTLGITAKVNLMRSQGIDVIGFGAGEPDFDTPSYIKEACITALKSGFTKYTATSGIPELKKAIIEKFQRDNNLLFTPEEIVVSCGAKHSLYNAIMVLCDRGDEVILATPYWISYVEMIRMSGAKPVYLKTTSKGNFKITPDALAHKITARTKLLLLNSPSNPTGTVYHKDELEELAKIIEQKEEMYVISDEIYEKLIYTDTKPASIASLNRNLKERTIIVNGVSKTYAMTGWRIGYAAGPRDIMQAISNLQDHSTSNPVSFAQKAAVAALSGPENEIITMKEEFKKRRNYMIELLKGIKHISFTIPEGAFYVFVDVSKLYHKTIRGIEIKDSISLAEAWLTFAKVAVVPGIAFGNDKYVRLSYATNMNNIKTGLERIKEFVTTNY